jgi:hypothetical protein
VRDLDDDDAPLRQWASSKRGLPLAPANVHMMVQRQTGVAGIEAQYQTCRTAAS